MNITFTVPALGKNPLGKPKLTRGQQWTKKAQDYAEWKGHVRACFAEQVPKGTPVAKRMAVKAALGKHPVSKGSFSALRLDVFIRFGDEKHCDPEGAYGAIADSIFEDDKHVSGGIDFSCRSKNPGVTVTIEIT